MTKGAHTDEAKLVSAGVTAEFLRIVYSMSRPVVAKRLKGVRPVGVSDHGAQLYDLATASSRLIENKIDLTDYLKTISVDDLPERLREPFWNAKLKQQRYEKNAGELWRTEAVIALFGSVLKDTKERIRLINTLAENTMGLSPTQLEKLREIVNDVQGGIYQSILDLESKTPASVAELNREYGEEDEADYESATTPLKSDDFEY